MDRQSLALLIPIIALSIPVMAIMMNGFYKIQKARLEEARLRHGAGGPEVLDQIDELREELRQVRTELIETQERLDFTERMLASGRSAGSPAEPPRP